MKSPVLTRLLGAAMALVALTGVAAAQADRPAILAAGVAALAAGAMSMAAGEYVSVHSQADTEQADGALTEDDCKNCKEEVQELTKKYEGGVGDLAKTKEAEVMEQ